MERHIVQTKYDYYYVAHYYCIAYIIIVVMRDMGFYVVLGMDANSNIRDGSVSSASALADISIAEAVISNHKGEFK